MSVCVRTLSCIGLFVAPWTFVSPPDSFVHGISQARILEWFAFSFSRGSSPTWDRTHISCISRWILYPWATRETIYSLVNFLTAENLTIFACHWIPGVKHWTLHRVNIQKLFMKDWIYVIIILILQINTETQESKCLCS